MKDRALSLRMQMASRCWKRQGNRFFFSVLYSFSLLLLNFYLPVVPCSSPLYCNTVKALDTLPYHGAQSLKTAHSSALASSVAHFFVTFHKLYFSISSPVPPSQALGTSLANNCKCTNWPLHPSTSGLNPQPGEVPQNSPAHHCPWPQRAHPWESLWTWLPGQDGKQILS